MIAGAHVVVVTPVVVVVVVVEVVTVVVVVGVVVVVEVVVVVVVVVLVKIAGETQPFAAQPTCNQLVGVIGTAGAAIGFQLIPFKE